MRGKQEGIIYMLLYVERRRCLCIYVHFLVYSTYLEVWEGACNGMPPMGAGSGGGGRANVYVCWLRGSQREGATTMWEERRGGRWRRGDICICLAMSCMYVLCVCIYAYMYNI